MVRNFKFNHYWSLLLIISVIFAPIIIIFLLFGEVNLAHKNYIIAKNSPTPLLLLPVSKLDLGESYEKWLTKIPIQYHDVFAFNKISWTDSENVAYYLNNQLKVHDTMVDAPQSIFFSYPDSTASPMPLFYGLIVLSGQFLLLAIYFGYLKWSLRKPKINFGESLVFLITIWTGSLTLIYSGAIPIFWGKSSYSWHILLIRLGLIIVSSSIGFVISFGLQRVLYKRFYPYDQRLGFESLMAIKNHNLAHGKKQPNTMAIELKE